MKEINKGVRQRVDWSGGRYDQMLTLCKTHTSQEMEKIMGINKNTIRSTLSRLGVQVKTGRGSPKVTDVEIAMMLEKRKQGVCLKVIAAQFGISYDRASRLTSKAYAKWKAERKHQQAGGNYE